MRQSGLAPGVSTYNAALTACEKVEQGQQAVKLLAVMLQSGLVPKVFTYSAAIRACEKL
jgi:pentatricopeptide repeat protein